MDDTPPAEKFFNEIYSVFLRWWEESDLDEDEMAGLATQAIEKFTMRNMAMSLLARCQKMEWILPTALTRSH